MPFNRVRPARLIVCLLVALALGALAASTAPASAFRTPLAVQPGPNFVVNVLGDAPADAGCTDADCSLREATVAANASSNVSELTFGVTGVITLTQGQLTVSSPITMTRPAGGITVSGNDAARIININSGATLVLAGVNLTRGNAAAASNGGAVFNSGTLRIEQSTISDSTAAFGGAIYNNNGTLRIEQSTFSGNTAANNGGGLYNAGAASTATVSLSTFSGNTATFGGAVFVAAGSVSLSQSTLGANTATSSGGAVYTNGGTTTAGLSTLSGNSAPFGGAIYGNAGSLTVTQSTLSANTATTNNGGGIYSAGSTVTVQQSTLSGNSSVSNGGAIYSNASLTVLQSTISGNSVSGGGAGGAGINLQGGSLSIGQTIVSDNTAPTQANIRRPGSTAVTSQGYNLIGSGYTTAFTAPGDQSGVNTPQLGPLQNNGGPTQTRLPAAGSPVIDAGPATSSFATDQRGFMRLVGATVDIGAVETNAPTAVTLLSFAGDRSAAGVTLRWRTGQEEAVIGYRVERQAPGGWLLVGEQTLSPSGSYTLTDAAALPGPQTYRLSARNADGSITALAELTVTGLRRLYLPVIER